MAKSTVLVLLAAVSSLTTAVSAGSSPQQAFISALAHCDTNYSVSSVIASYSSAQPALFANMTSIPTLAPNATAMPPFTLINTEYVNMSATVPPVTSVPAATANTIPAVPNLNATTTASLTSTPQTTPTGGSR